MEELNYSQLKWKPVFYGSIVGAVFLAIGLIVAISQYRVQYQNELNEARSISELIEQNIENIISDSYVVALSLALTVDDNGEVHDFERVASQLIDDYESVDLLELVPDGVIEYVYPLEGNESVLGYDIANDPKVNAEVLRAAELGRMYFAGPINLKQGGQAIIGRLPIMIDSELWGFSAVLIYLDTFIEQAGFNDFSSDLYYFQLSKENPNTGVEEFFLPVNEDIDLNDSEPLIVPEGDWRLYAVSTDNRQPLVTFILIAGLSGIGAVILGFLSFKMFRKPEDLQKLLHERSEELLKSREEFKKSSDLLASVLDSPKEMVVYSLDKELKYIEYNSNHRKLIKEWAGTEIGIGRSVFDGVSEETRSVMKERFDRAFNGESFEFDFEIDNLKGKHLFWRSRVSPIRNNNGEIFGVTVFSTDITKQKLAEQKLAKNEQRYRTLIANSPFCIHEVNVKGELISINRAGLDMFGIEKEENFLGITYPELLGEEEAVPVLQLFEESLEGKASEFKFEKNGRYFISSFIPLKGENGSVNRIMGITQDITERHKSEEFIENSLKEKITLLSEIHHRVKNNLAIVSGLLELQKFETQDPVVTDAFEHSINRIISIAMVHELMYNTSDLSSINVHSYLVKLIPAISKTMQNKKKEVEFDLDVAEYRLNINEAIPLGLLLNELITNSFKYAFKEDSEHDKICIKLKVEDEQVKVLFEDNGVGFPEHVTFDEPKNLGLNLIHAQLQQLDATHEVDTDSKFKLFFSFKVQGKGSHSNIA